MRFQPSYRKKKEGEESADWIDLDYIRKEDGVVTTLIAWSCGDKLYLLRIDLSGYKPLNSSAENVPEEVKEITVPELKEVHNINSISSPWKYKDIKQLRVLALNDKFLVLFTAKREDKQTEEYGYDLLYLIVDKNGNLKIGPADLGFHDVLTFQAKLISKDVKSMTPSLIGLAVMGKWLQQNFGVWWTILGVEGSSIKVLQDPILVSDQGFKVPKVERALIDFGYYKVEDNDGITYKILVVWNDCRSPDILADRIYRITGAGITYEENKLWIVYGQRLKVDLHVSNGNIWVGTTLEPEIIRERWYRESEGEDNHIKIETEKVEIMNFPIVYLATMGGAGGISFGEIDSITVYTSRDKDGRAYFVVDASVKIPDTAVSGNLSWVHYGCFELGRETYGFDVLSVPVPVDPDYGTVATEVGTSTKKLYIIYPIFNANGVDAIPVPQSNKYPDLQNISTNIEEKMIIPVSHVFLCDTIQFDEVYKIGICRDQINVKSVSLHDGVVVEGFIERSSDGKNRILIDDDHSAVRM
ncbi:hypothetical protein [Methanopyrus sp. SNP6]|uniref:hypothetical protein n=1 Tax=Methanopyrus sp. SNP6 TaxID=1937005 RepID=UPI00143A2FEE|nr:hypothetical protein [Methanopyrus sp. SNP6]